MNRIGRSAVALLSLGMASSSNSGELKLPIACEVGRTCFIQNYVDVDPGSASMDYTCGSLTYDGHNGTDFRLPSHSAEQPDVAVVAAADGKVLRARDGIDDVAIERGGRDKVDGRECGNGVVVQHSQNRETQYCHMAKGSVRVKPGDAVKAGQVLGKVGMSGLTEYLHLHFVLRKDGKVIDPFADGRAPGVCMGNAENHWQESVRAQLAYSPRTVLNFGFASETVTNEAVESGEVLLHKPTADSPAIVAFIRTIGLKTGDVQKLTLRGPVGDILSENRAVALERNRAQSLLYSGRLRPGQKWSRGTYTAAFVVSQDGQAVLEQQFQFELQ